MPENDIRNEYLSKNRSEFSDTVLEDQSALLPTASQALSGVPWLFQKRVDLFSHFRLYAKDGPAAPEYELLKRDSYLFDGATLCPQSRQVLVLGPGLQENGKPMSNGKARRLYIYSLDSGTVTPVWKMEKDDRGQIAAPISATPDCQHILVNLRLEAEKNRTPYGRLVYVKNEPRKSGELPSAKLGEIPPQGFLKGFAFATFVQPPHPLYYKSSAQPPVVFATQEYMPDGRGRPRAYLFQPGRTGMSWQRQTIEVDTNIQSVTATPVFYNRLDTGFSLVALNDSFSNGLPRTAIAALTLGENPALHVISSGGPLRLMSLAVHPEGQKLSAAFVLADTASNPKNKPYPKAGIVEVTLAKEGKPTYSLLDAFGPFQALGQNHNPRPTYTSDGQWLIYSVPAIGDGADPKLFEPTASVDLGLQFPTKLIQWKLN